MPIDALRFENREEIFSGYDFFNVFWRFDNIFSINRLIAKNLQRCKSQDRFRVHFSLDFYTVVDKMTITVDGETERILSFTQFGI